MSRERWARPGRWVLLALALGAVWPAREQVFLGKVFWVRDVHLIWQSHVESLVRVVMAGSWPLRNPAPGFGQPMLGDPDYMVTYPLTWLNFVMQPWRYYTLFVVLHLFWSALGAYLLARLWRCSTVAALAGAFLWILSGPVLSLLSLWHHFASACWAPWVFVCAERTFMTRRWSRAGRWGAASGLQILAGSADVVAMTLAVLAVYTAAVRVRWTRPLCRRNRRLAALSAVALSLAVGMGALLAVAAFNVLRNSPRQQQDPAVRTYWSVHPLQLVEALLPIQSQALPLEKDLRKLFFESREAFLTSLYLGVGTLPLVGAAFLRRRTRRRVLALGIVVAAAALISLGRFAPFYGILVALVPPLRILRYPVKCWIVLAFAWALLCAHGVDVWRSAQSVSRRAWVTVVLYPSVIAGVAALALAAFAWRAPLTVMNLVLQPGGTREDVVPLLAPVEIRLLGAFTAAAGAVALGVAHLRHVNRRPALAAAVAGLAAGELAFALHAQEPAATPRLYARPPVVDVLRADHVRRVYSYEYYASEQSRAGISDDGLFPVIVPPPGWSEAEAGALLQQLHLAVSTAGRWGLSTGYEKEMHNLAPRDLTQMVLLVPQLEHTPLHLRFLRMAGITHAVGLHAGPFSDLKPLATLPNVIVRPVLVFEVPRPLPMAYVVAGVRPADGPYAFAELLSSTFDPEREVVLPASAPAAPVPEAGTPGTATIDDHRPDRLLVRATASEKGGYLVVLEGYDPAWRAEVDGRPAPVLRANIAFLAVPLPPGLHTVSLRYRPRGTGVGLGISLASVAACVLLARGRS